MKKLNSIIEDYYKEKNKIIHNDKKDKKEDNEIMNNNDNINVNKSQIKIIYSSSCDNKKIRTSSCFHEPKVTIFHHFNGKHTINNSYRS